MNFQMFKLHLEKAEEPEIKLPTSVGLSKKQEFQKNIYFCIIDYAKAFDCVDHNKMWKILEEMGYQITLPASWEICMQVKKQQLESDMEQLFATPNLFQIGKGICQGCTLSSCLFNLCAGYIMQNARLDKVQAGIKIAERNINNFRYTDDTTLMQKAKWN